MQGSILTKAVSAALVFFLIEGTIGAPKTNANGIVSATIEAESCNVSKAVNCETPSVRIAKEECNLNPSLIEEIASYKDIANRIIQEVLHGSYKGRAYADLEHFVDTFGPRFSGTRHLEDAIDFMLDRMKNNFLENVHGELASVPQWVR